MVYCKILIFMIKLTIENESITSFQHFEIWGFILTMRNVNDYFGTRITFSYEGFILTMRNVNVKLGRAISAKVTGFILTMRNVNGSEFNILKYVFSVLY